MGNCMVFKEKSPEMSRPIRWSRDDVYVNLLNVWKSSLPSVTLHQCDTHGLRLTVGRALHFTLFLLCSRTFLLINGMLSALSQTILANVVFLISCSMAALNAVRSVFKVAFGAFSCQKRSPTLRRRNCSATTHWKVGPRTPPSLGRGSSIPEKGKELKII